MAIMGFIAYVTVRDSIAMGGPSVDLCPFRIISECGRDFGAAREGNRPRSCVAYWGGDVLFSVGRPLLFSSTGRAPYVD